MAGNAVPPRLKATRRGFDFTGYMDTVCQAVVTQNPELAHVRMNAVATAFCQARKRVPHGLFASLTPLRFKDGAETEVRRGRTYRIQQLAWPDGRQMLYILRFYLPRFLDLPFREKLITVFHELWHISPQFNGDLRRHPGRCFAHSHSQAEYDELMGEFVDRWVATHDTTALLAPLRLSFNELLRTHHGLWGLRIPRPRLLPV